MRGGQPSELNAATVTALVLLPSRFYAGPDGRVYCDIPPQLGCSFGFKGVPVFGGGGGIARYVQVGQPSAVNLAQPSNLPQVLIQFVGTERYPVATAQMTAPGGTSATAPEVADGIRPALLGVEDHGAVNGGSVVSQAPTGRLTADLRGATDPTFGVQLPAGGTMPVSRAGDSSGRLVLVAEMEDYLADIRTQFASAMTWLTAVSIAAGVPVPGAPGAPILTLPAFPDPTARTFGAAVLPVSPDAE